MVSSEYYIFFKLDFTLLLRKHITVFKHILGIPVYNHQTTKPPNLKEPID
jgi:hypothetical protein